MANDPIVWVLGAGFSRALGGPLLRDLFSAGSSGDLDSRFAKGEYPVIQSDAARRAWWLYELGLGPDRPASNRSRFGAAGERLWRDAEEFLEYLDIAASNKDSPLRVRLDKLLQANGAPDAPPRVPEVSDAAKQLMAAECSGFLVGQTTAQERWAPYVRWATEVVASQDTIITFNYDRVLETIHSEHALETNHMGVWVPGTTRNGTIASVLKLHGSVDWEAVGAGIRSRHDDPFFAVHGAPTSLVLGTPGPRKLKITEQLEPLWKYAEEALGKASAVVFLGYRFPQTDAAAKTRLLGAIAANPKGVTVRTVLGDDVFSAGRVRALIDYAIRGAEHRDARLSVTPEPLFVEDFLTVCTRKAIFTVPLAR